jgi:hypothetical protein
MSGRWFAKVLLPEPLPLSLKQSIDHFANGTGCVNLQWPADKENRKEGKRANPPEAWLAYASQEDRQAALDQNQQRPGEWGFYAAAAKGSKESKERKSGRSLEGEEQTFPHREAFSELQPPQVGRGGLLGDAPSDWGYSVQQQPFDVWTDQQEVFCQDQWQSGNWSSSNWTTSRDEWGSAMYMDPPVQQPQQQQQQPQQQQPSVHLSQPTNVLQPSGQFQPCALPPVEDLVRSLDFLDHEDESEYRSQDMCLPSGLVAEDEDFTWGAESTPPRMRRAQTWGAVSPETPPTPGSAAAVAMWRPIVCGLPCRHTFIHFKPSSSSRRSRSCPADTRAAVEEMEEMEAPELHRASTFDAPPLLWAQDDAILLASDEPMELAESPVRVRMLESAIETPQRQGFALGEEHTPAPKQGPPRARRGGRGRHGKGERKLGSHSWRPSLWIQETH